MEPEIPKLDVDDANSTSDLLYVSEMISDRDLEREEERASVADELERRPHPTAMIRSFGWLARLIARFLFAHVLFEDSLISQLKSRAKRDTTVYVMQTRSLLDYLYFNWAFVENDLPLPQFSNGVAVRIFQGVWRYLFGFLRRGTKADDEDVFHALTEHRRPSFLFLEQPLKRRTENETFSQKFLFRLVRTQREHTEKIVVVPLVLVWERRPNEKHATIVEEVFGSVQSPGFFRKFFYWFRTVWQSFLRFGQPVARVSEVIEMDRFLDEVPQASTADAAELLRSKLIDQIENERRVILGPVAEKPASIWEQILVQPSTTRVVSQLALEEEKTEAEIVNRAHDQFREIAAETSLMTLKILSAFLSLVWYRIYDGFEVDEVGLEKVRDVARNSSIILIPSHKSHIDYLVISYLFYHYGMNNPLIAAGANLNFWPLGPVFRRAGAFFIRRTFKGDLLYKTVFREYLTIILQQRHPVEFFIEGTRSRTGKLVKPKYGMLEMIVSAYASGKIESIKLIPVAVNYERVIESRAHRDEQLGGEKEKESLGGLLKTPQFLTRKYGRTYVEFNEPIDLGDYLSRYGLGGSLSEVSETNDDLTSLIVRLGHRIIYDINEVTTVTPTALAATILLSNDPGGVGRARFLADVGFVLRFLTEPERDVRLSRTLHDALSSKSISSHTDPAGSQERNPVLESLMGRASSDLIDWALQVFEESDQLKIKKTKEKEDNYIVPSGARLEGAYYRNTIVHHFVPEALLSTAICSFEERSIPLEQLMERTLYLSRMFKYEWIYEERAEFENVFHRSLEYFALCGWLKVNGEVVKVRDPIPDEVTFFRRQVANFLEAYHLVAGRLDQLEKPTEMSDFVSSTLKYAKKELDRRGGFSHESLSNPTYQNALRLYADWGILERSYGEKGKPKFVFVDDGKEAADRLLTRLEQYVLLDRFDDGSGQE